MIIYIFIIVSLVISLDITVLFKTARFMYHTMNKKKKTTKLEKERENDVIKPRATPRKHETKDDKGA